MTLEFLLATQEQEQEQCTVIGVSVTKLPEVDASVFLDSDEAVAAYLSDILQAHDSALLASEAESFSSVAEQRPKTCPI